MTAVKHALEVAIKRRRRTERLALLGGGNQGDFVTPSRPTYLGMSETPDSGVDTPATAARPVSDKKRGRWLAFIERPRGGCAYAELPVFVFVFIFDFSTPPLLPGSPYKSRGARAANHGRGHGRRRPRG
jgi:hypothetical protein